MNHQKGNGKANFQLMPPDQLQMAVENMAQDIHNTKMNIMALTKTLMEAEIIDSNKYQENFKKVTEDFMTQVRQMQEKQAEEAKFTPKGVEIREND